MMLLERFARPGYGLAHRHNLLMGLQHGYDSVGATNGDAAMRRCGEAFDWLVANGLLAQDPHQSSAFCYVTDGGREALEAGDGSAYVAARRRLGEDLHPRLEKVRTDFLLGDYGTAVFKAMREVEVAVRDHAGATNRDLGTKLMRKAFGEGGALADEEAEPSERQGVADLFAGAIATFKNPSSHRIVEFDDPTFASDVVMLADLLLRLVDRVG